MVDKLSRSPDFQGRPDRAQVDAALNRITHRIVAQPDWGEERPSGWRDLSASPAR